LGKLSINFTYEQMCDEQEKIQNKIKAFIPALHDFDLNKPAWCHSIDGTKNRKLINLNGKQIARLKDNQFKEINIVLKRHGDIMEYWKYDYYGI